MCPEVTGCCYGFYKCDFGMKNLEWYDIMIHAQMLTYFDFRLCHLKKTLKLLANDYRTSTLSNNVFTYIRHAVGTLCYDIRSYNWNGSIGQG